MDIQALYPRLDNIQLIAKRIVEGFLTGLHKSPHHGFSVEFAEHREYYPGDPLKYVDWKVYGRTEKMHIKKFEEETNVRTYLLLDTSSSMHFKYESEWNKLEYGALLTASLAHLAQKQLDGIAYGFFTDKLESISPVKSNNRHFQQLIVALEKEIREENTGRKTDIAASLDQLMGKIHKRSLIYIISDFLMDDAALSELENKIDELSHFNHEIVLISLHDIDKEIHLNFEDGNYTFRDIETNKKIDLQVEEVKDAYRKAVEEHFNRLKTFCVQRNLDLIVFDIKQSPEEILKNYLINRIKTA